MGRPRVASMRPRAGNRGVLRWPRRRLPPVWREPTGDPGLADQIAAMAAREGERQRRGKRPVDEGRRLTEIRAAETQVADELRACAARLEATLESALDEAEPGVEERMLARFEARVVGTRAAATVRPAPDDTDPIDVNHATLAELRQLMSLTQARRVIKYRERAGGFKSLDELALVPGLPVGLRRVLTIRS